MGAMHRLPSEGQWKTNASLGAVELPHKLTAPQAEAAWAARQAFPECRQASVDLLTSGQVLEINAFPGANGLLNTHGTVLGARTLDRLEAELAEHPGVSEAGR
jgi:glutathione synthase/RimK-type ligase-like ATP-grasp enzyme